MRKVIKIHEKLTVMVNDSMVNILDDTTFIPLNIDDMKLIAENLNLCSEEEEPPKKATSKKATKKSEPKVESKTEKEKTQPVDNINSENDLVEVSEVVEDFKEVPPKNPFI
ncbi:MAG: hypothetical protein ACRCX2_04330 [Paraclostridium sp.]